MNNQSESSQNEKVWQVEPSLEALPIVATFSWRFHKTSYAQQKRYYWGIWLQVSWNHISLTYICTDVVGKITRYQWVAIDCFRGDHDVIDLTHEYMWRVFPSSPPKNTCTAKNTLRYQLLSIKGPWFSISTFSG